MATITAANSTFSISVAGLFPVPQLLDGYAVDDAFTAETVSNVETLIGVDGKKSAGFVFSLFPLSITLQADSPSNLLFETIAAQQIANKEVFTLTGVIIIPGISRTFALVNGSLKTNSPFPAVKRTLQSRVWSTDWQSILGAPI